MHLADQPVHLLRDATVGGMPLWRRSKLDQVHRLPRVHLHHEPDPVRHGHGVLGCVLQPVFGEIGIQVRRLVHDALPIAEGPRFLDPGGHVVAVLVRQRLPLDREQPVPLEVAERAVVTEDVESVAGSFERASRLVTPVRSAPDVRGEDGCSFGG